MFARILVVDDEPDMLDLIAFNLREAGCRVFTADNGRDGLRHAQRTLPDLILLDVMLPDMDGFSVCELLRKLPSTASIPVVMVTAIGGEMARAHGLGSGAIDFVRKPFEMANLIERIEHTLAHHVPSPPSHDPDDDYYYVKSIE